MLCRVVAASILLLITIPFAPNASAAGKKSHPVAAAKTPSGTPATTNSAGYSQDQVDGIMSACEDSLWDKTDYYWHHGDYPRIVAIDRLITEIDPRFMEPYSTGGWLIESMGDNANAEAYYKLGVSRNQDSSYLYYMLEAFYFNTLKDYSDAVKVGEIDITKPDADVNDWRMLAHSYEKNKQLDKALLTWKTIKAKYPTAVAVDLNLERVQKLVDSKNLPAGAATPASPSTSAPNPVISL